MSKTGFCRHILLSLPVIYGLGACTTLPNADNIRYEDIGSFMHLQEGVVTAHRKVNISPGQSGTGAVTGAIAGASLGSDSDGIGVRGVLGALFGGLFGAAVEKSLSEKQGYAYTIRLKNSGDMISVVQADEEPIAVGTPVTVETDKKGFSRVIPGVVDDGRGGYGNRPDDTDNTYPLQEQVPDYNETDI